MWDTICGTLNSSYGKNYNGHKYKYDFFSRVIPLIPDVGSIDYLELGSYEGVSLVIVAYILSSLNLLGQLVSVDPYFSDGYFETPPGQERLWKDANAETYERVLMLYRNASIKVDLRRATSASVLPALLTEHRTFKLIFVDGNHEQLNPLIDISLSYLLLSAGGILCLDDINWPDVKPISLLCERHMDLLFETKTQRAFRKRLA